MRKILCFKLAAIFILFFNIQAMAQENGKLENEEIYTKEAYNGEAYYDFGVFSFEDRDYENAEKNFQKALTFSPDNPYYNHFLGKTYLKTKQYEPAREYFFKAKQINPDIPDLKYDIAVLNYETGSYEEAAAQFIEITKQEPENILAHYHAGINFFKLKKYSQALKFFLKSSQGSPTIKANGSYYAGVCLQKTGNYDRAAEMFEYVRDNSDSIILVENAVNWLEGIDKLKKSRKPYSLYLKLTRQYDSNARLEPSDLDIDLGADKSDWASIIFFSGKYNFINRGNFITGARYSHYQKWYDDLDDFNPAGSLFDLYTEYNHGPFAFAFNYLPSFYWIDSDSYLRRHQIKPQFKWRINENLSTALSYSYYDNNYIDDDNRDGHTNALFLNMQYDFLSNKARFLAGIGYKDNSASHQNYCYGETKAQAETIFLIPWDLKLSLNLKYSDKKYDNTDSYYSVKRNDDKLSGSVSLTRKLYFEWLSISAEFQYTKNDSNIKDFEYTRAETSLSLTARY